MAIRVRSKWQTHWMDVFATQEKIARLSVVSGDRFTSAQCSASQRPGEACYASGVGDPRLAVTVKLTYPGHVQGPSNPH